MRERGREEETDGWMEGWMDGGEGWSERETGKDSEKYRERDHVYLHHKNL